MRPSRSRRRHPGPPAPIGAGPRPRRPAPAGRLLGILLLVALACRSGGPAPAPADPSEPAGPSTGLAEARAPAAKEEAPLAAAWAALGDDLVRAEHSLRTAPAFGSPAERARGYEFLVRSLIQSLESQVLQDPDLPWFRILDFWLRGGGDNPDQRYAFSPIRGGETYRIRGTLGSARRVELQLYAGQPWAGSGRSAGYLAFEDLAVDDEGRFRILLSPEPPEPSPEGANDANGSAAEPPETWLANPPGATTVFVRHVYDVWDERSPGDVHIDRVGHEGMRAPLPRVPDMADRIRAAGSDLATRVRTWPAFVQRRYLEATPTNEVSTLYDTYRLGGVKGRWMAGGHFELSPGQVLVLRTWPTKARYQAVQLTDLWFDSLEYGNLVSSLNTTQVEIAPDGAIYHVISAEDPGHPNWLDTGGRRRGLFLLRWDGVQGEIPAERHPDARVMDRAELPERIPGFRAVDEAEREQVRRARRRHLQNRSHR